MSEQELQAELVVCCQAPGVKGLTCEVDVFGCDSDEPAAFRQIPGNTPARFRLCPGRYRVRVRNTAGWNPGGVTRWVTLRAGKCCHMHPVFRGGTGPQPRRRVTVTLTDANYPGIIPINGGITVWHSTP